MQANRSSDTGPEVALRSALHARGLRFRKHHRPVAGLRCRADIVFPSERVAVFVQGCFWHGCQAHGVSPRTNAAYWNAKIARNRERDDQNSAALAAAGWRVLQIWEHEPLDDAAAQVVHAVEEARSLKRARR
jgi:DNA mismatch endonuclease (patch repair protein)